MQIRKQFRKQSIALDPHSPLARGNRPAPTAGMCLVYDARTGTDVAIRCHHSIHTRIRFKARSRHHGTKTGQSKKASK